MGHNTIIILYKLRFNECGDDLTVNGNGGCDGVD